MAAATDLVGYGPDDPGPHPAGWPRPLYQGLPVPYVTEWDWLGMPRWSQMDWVRVAECVQEFRCQVCGLDCPDDDLCVLTSQPVGALVHAGLDRVVCLPGGPLHRRCARLAREGPEVVRLAAPRTSLVVRWREGVVRQVPAPWDYALCGPFRGVL
jgi:hypothetical protein